MGYVLHLLYFKRVFWMGFQNSLRKLKCNSPFCSSCNDVKVCSFSNGRGILFFRTTWTSLVSWCGKNRVSIFFSFINFLCEFIVEFLALLISLCSFTIDNLYGSRQFLLNMNISFCFESHGDCYKNVTVFENTLLPKKLCPYTDNPGMSIS
jgi:hypothetical protein